MEKYLKKIYYDPKNPAFFTSIAKLRKAAIDAGYQASYGQISRWLHNQETYSISREAKTHFPRNQVTASGLNHEWTCDLCDYNNIANENDGYGYFLIIMDQFSRKVYAVKLKTKKPVEVIEAFKSIFSHGVKPKYSLYTDKGMEFAADIVRNYFKNLGIKQFFAANETKASSIERALKSIKIKLHKYFLEKQHHRWVDILQDVVTSYNNSVHRSLGVTPNEANSADEELVRYNQAIIRQKSNGILQKVQKAQEAITQSKISVNKVPGESSGKIKKKVKKQSHHSVMIGALPKRRRAKYKVGYLVRISRIKEVFSRAYSHQFTAEIFEVQHVDMRDGIPVYKLISYEKRDAIKGVFYEEELLRAYPRKSKNYKIGDILKTRGAGRTKEAYVSWFLHPKSYNSWVPYKSVRDLPNSKERKLVEKSKKAYLESHRDNNNNSLHISQAKKKASTAQQGTLTVSKQSTESKKAYEEPKERASKRRNVKQPQQPELTRSRDTKRQQTLLSKKRADPRQIKQQTRYSTRLRAKKLHIS